MTGSWKLVPVEADEAMACSAVDAATRDRLVYIYCQDGVLTMAKDYVRGGIKAAPTPPDEVLERMARAHLSAMTPGHPVTDECWAQMRDSHIPLMRAALSSLTVTGSGE